MEPEKIEKSESDIQNEAIIADLNKQIEELTKTTGEQEEKIVELQAYIANYVSSSKPGEKVNEEPKAFKDVYAETIFKMSEKE